MARHSLIVLRRRELQKAAYQVACAHGFRGLTVERVARHAGSSKGVVHHYFDSKHELVEYATRYAHGILAKAVREKLRHAITPSERLWAIVDGNFSPESLKPEFFRLWFESLEDRRLTYIVLILEKRMRSTLIHALKQLGCGKEASGIAYDIMNMYDGFWALASVEPSLTRGTVLLLIADYVKDVVPAFDLGVIASLRQ
jgi:TetR/AcrR family transcriptional repressor of bet genes